MRIDLERGGRRSWFEKLLLFFLGRYIGMVPGPMLFQSYDSAQVPEGLMNYLLRSVAHRGAFRKSERELIAAFISDLNSCHF